MRMKTVLRPLLDATTTHDLETMLQALERTRKDTPDATVAFAIDTELTGVNFRVSAVISLVEEELRDRAAWSVPESLRHSAGCTILAWPSGDLNIASWVGVRTPQWYAVFSYSSPAPGAPANEASWPWFSQLDPETQHWVLLLVAEILETEE